MRGEASSKLNHDPSTTKKLKGSNLGSQHTENLFRRFKGEVVTLKTMSGGVFEGRISEITNDYVCLVSTSANDKAPTFVFFAAVESFVVHDVPSET